MDGIHSKSTLLEMNSNRAYGFNWIMNLENIKDNELSKLYPTGNAGIASGRLYVALPINTKITFEIRNKFNMW